MTSGLFDPLLAAEGTAAQSQGGVTSDLFDPLVVCSRFSRPAPAASVHMDSVIS